MRVHDLLHLEPRPEWLRFEGDADAAMRLLAAWPVAVVRRVAWRQGWVPVGVRGRARSERFAAWVAPQAVRRVDTPEALLERTARRELPALCALHTLRQRWDGWAWGPTGSVGFELACGAEAVTAASDLDVRIRAEHAFSRAQARALLEGAAGLGVSVDAQVETPYGGFALAEYAMEERCMLRTDDGPLMTAWPWQEQAVVA